MEHRKSLIESSKKWESLGTKTMLINVAAQFGSKKIIDKSTRITEEIKNSEYKLEGDFNFLGINLRNSGILCIDVDPVTPESVPNFYSFLRRNSINSDTLLIERSMNGGLHVYFRSRDKNIEDLHFCKFCGIYFDVIANSRVFTSPSSFKNKKYEWIGREIGQVNRVEEIQELPEFLFDSIRRCDIYRK